MDWTLSDVQPAALKGLFLNNMGHNEIHYATVQELYMTAKITAEGFPSEVGLKKNSLIHTVLISEG